MFTDAGYELALVGGSVRDILLRRDSKDLDFTTNATPEQMLPILKRYCDDIWDIGRDFGTIGGNKYTDGKSDESDESDKQSKTCICTQIEVTTYRSDEYSPKSRKPEVKYGNSLETDLSRRDFTINAIALKLPDVELVDPFMGIADLTSKIIRTPIDPELSFSDDPLRMMRAVRFSASLATGDFTIEPTTASAIIEMSSRLKIVSVERIHDEFVKALMSDNPRKAIEEFIGFGLNQFIIPEFEDLKMQIDPEHHHKDVFEHSLKVLENAISYENEYLGGADLIIRLSALLHDIAKPLTKRVFRGGKVSFRHHDVEGAKMAEFILKRLKFDKKTIKSVSKLVELHMRFYGYGDAAWSDSAVRRYAFDAGEELTRLHVLTRSDVTTKNAEKADRLAHAYNDIERRIAEIKEKEELGKIRPDLDGNEIIELLELDMRNSEHHELIKKAYKYMLNYRIENGEISKSAAKKLLLDWANHQV